MDRSNDVQGGKGNAAKLAYVSFFVAALSLATSVYQGYLNTRFVELMQSSVTRAETARTCKDLIDAYFQIKFRVKGLALAFERERNLNSPATIAAASEAQNAVSRFGAYGTYLANYQGEAKRGEYTRLTNELLRLTEAAYTTASADLPKQFEKADAMFGAMNADCVASVKGS